MGSDLVERFQLELKASCTSCGNRRCKTRNVGQESIVLAYDPAGISVLDLLVISSVPTYVMVPEEPPWRISGSNQEAG